MARLVSGLSLGQGRVGRWGSHLVQPPLIDSHISHKIVIDSSSVNRKRSERWKMTSRCENNRKGKMFSFTVCI